MTSIECLKEALRLHEEAPDAKVVFMVNNEETCDPFEFAYSQQEPVSAELTFLWDDGEGSLEEEDAVEKIYDRIETGYADADEAEAEAKRRWEYEKYPAIVVYLGAK